VNQLSKFEKALQEVGKKVSTCIVSSSRL